MRGVPRATLHRMTLKNPSKIGFKSGLSTVFTEEEELNIINWIICEAKIDYSVTK